MDQDLKLYLEAMESRMDNRMVTLMTDVKESLERQIKHLSGRFDAQAIRLDRQAALLQIGARWTNRMIAGSERVDVAHDKRIQEIGELRSRVEKLEDGPK
jgi:hypothetical protein